MDNEQNNNKIIERLLGEFQEHRDAIMSMIKDIEEMRSGMDKLFPKSLDSRYVRFFEEKVKTITEFFKTILEMRKEIQKSLKDEIEFRRKVTLDEKGISIEEMIDVRSVAKTIEKYKQESLVARKLNIENSMKETEEISKEVEY